MKSMMKLYKHQKDAVKQLSSRKILVGGVGSGKSHTALSFYINNYMDRGLVIITTAKKRDSGDWHMLCVKHTDGCFIVDSWNNIAKYANYKAFFIFDEQRLCGKGKWVKTFINISANNPWILLTATPGDTWYDYVPIFIANKYFTSRNNFEKQHVTFKPYMPYPVIECYRNEEVLEKYKQDVSVYMNFEHDIVTNQKWVLTSYDKDDYMTCVKKYYDPIMEEKLNNISSVCHALRRITSHSDGKRLSIMYDLLKHNKVICFYNYVYESYDIERIANMANFDIAFLNGQKHEEIPKSDKWVYAVQYQAGSEAWQCYDCDTIIFYSLPYSYKMFKQAKGRITRIDSDIKEVNYIYYSTESSIDVRIRELLAAKKSFNEKTFMI